MNTDGIYHVRTCLSNSIITCRRIDCEQIGSRINQKLIAGRFGNEGLHQLHRKLFCMQLTKAFLAEASCNQLLIDSATYLLTINSPTLKSVAMSLYNTIIT